MLRSLIHHRAVHAAVALAVAVTTAVLSGALVVGDSVRGSLRALALDRLGTIAAVVVSPRPFPAGLAARVGGARPVLLASGAATHAESRSRASDVAVVGVEEGFAELWSDAAPMPLDRAERQFFPSVVLNRSLAAELGAKVGDAVVLRFEGVSDIPRDTLMGETDVDAVVASMRTIVRGVVDDRGPGRFGIAVGQRTPRNAFVSREALARALERDGAANALLFPLATAEGAPDRVRAALTASDLGLSVRPGEGWVSVESDAFVVSPVAEATIARAAESFGLDAWPISTYVANTVRVSGREVPYSMVAAVDPKGAPEGSRLFDRAGRRVERIAPGEAWLTSWTARELDASAGDTVEVDFFAYAADETLEETTRAFRVAGVLAERGLAVDDAQAPDYPGLSDADDIADWDPPFPVDLDRVRPEDEAYWDAYGPTPKLYVALEEGREAWATRHGSATAVRVAAPTGADATDFADRIEARLDEHVDPPDFGLSVDPVREVALEASAGTTDFAGLFVGFSLFLIVSSAVLVGLLFRLGVERRAAEIGTRLALGFRVAVVRRAFVAEASLVAAAGVVLGTAAAVGYGAAMVRGLSTVWSGAVGTDAIGLVLVPSTLAGGAVGAWLVAMAVVSATVWRLARIPVPRLLGGETTAGRGPGVSRAPVATALAASCGALAVGLAAFASATGRGDDPAIAFVAAVLALVAGLAAFARFTRRTGVSRPASGLVGLASRNGRANPGRSLLAVALVAAAAFMIVAVGANRVDFSETWRSPWSGAGGFALIASSAVPLHSEDGGRWSGVRLDVFDEDGVSWVPLRERPGDDASCLNLYRPDRPRVLGVPVDSGALDGRFSFRATVDASRPDDPWTLLKEDLGPGVVPAVADVNSATWILKVGLGDGIELEDDRGRPVELRIVGLLDTSVFQSELLIDAERFRELFPWHSGFGAFLVDAPPDRVVAVRDALERDLEDFGFDAISTERRLERYKEVEHTYLATFQLLGGLGLLLGTVGLAIVGARNVLERRRELATLRAVGWPRRRIATLVVLETAFVLTLGVGLGAAAALVAVVPRVADLAVPWIGLGVTLAVVWAFGAVASVTAVAIAIRTPLVASLKVDR